MSRVITFYSYKGGVGRTFALANVAALLAKRGKRVLLMDWDLEAPGLHRYFKQYLSRDLMPKRGVIHLLHGALEDPKISWDSFVSEFKIEDNLALSIILSGDQAKDYVERVRTFSWTNFFENRQGGVVLERWRREWKEQFDFVILDSRTGITDTGGVCTIFMPDILVLVFSTNEQSFDCGIQIVRGVQESRRTLEVPRPPAAILPLLGRFDGRDEVDESKQWLDRFGLELKPFYDDWLPKQFVPRQILEMTKIPYVTRFSFGEPLPVLSHGTSDPELPGFYLENITKLLASDFQEAQQILAPEEVIGKSSVAEFRARLAEVPIDHEALKKALALVEDELGEAALPELLNEAGVALLRQGNFEPAETYFRKALAISETEFDVEDSSIISSLTHLAELLSSTEQFSEAEELYRRALAILEEVTRPSDQALATVYNNLAEILRETDRASEAEELYQQALIKLERYSRPDKPYLATTYNNLAALLRATGRLVEAEEIYRRVICLAEEYSRPGDTALATAHSNLAKILHKMGRELEAVEVYDRALHKLEMFSRPGDRALVTTYNNFAKLLSDIGRLSEAEKIYRRALDVIEMSSRPGDRILATTYNNLARVLLKMGHLSEAEKLYETALHNMEKYLRPDDPALITTYNDFAKVLSKMGHLSEAEDIYQETLRKLEVYSRPGDRSLTSTYNNYAKLLREVGKMQEAEYVYRLLIKSLEKMPKKKSPQLGVALNDLGEVLLSQHNINQAEQLFRRSLAILGMNHTIGRRASRRLASILEQKGQKDKAREILEPQSFDTVIIHDSKDKKVVRQLAIELEASGVRVWFDEWELVPGMPWVETLKELVDSAASVIVCIGSSGSPWALAEMENVLHSAIVAKRPVIPVFLPGSPEYPEIPSPLKNFTAVDLREGIITEQIHRLVWGITGNKPNYKNSAEDLS